MLEIFQYNFIVRGLIAGLIVAAVAPLIGIFLVLRRYSLIADTLSHVSLAGIAFGMLFGINPALTALVTTVLAALGLEKLRTGSKIYGESVLAIFLSGSLALALIILSLAEGFNASLFSYLFGSIVTVTVSDIYMIAALGAIVSLAVIGFFKELFFVSFDEESARVSGLPVNLINMVFILLAALTVSLSIPIVGVLLIAALLVIPAVTALRFGQGFWGSLVYAEIISIFSVVSGIFLAYYLDLSAGGTIVMVMLAFFGASLFLKKRE